MSLQPQPVNPVPLQTAQIAKAAFPKGNTFMLLRDKLGTLFTDEDFAQLFASRGQPALSPWQLAFVTLMQFAEGLTDRQAADAVRARLDWKYALSLELTDPGFHYSVLSEFRDRLAGDSPENLLLDRLLEVCREQGWLRNRANPHSGAGQRTDSTHIQAAVRTLNRLEMVGETLRSVLNILAMAAPDWLCTVIAPDWFDRYSVRVETYRLPATDRERITLAECIGGDGYRLLGAIYDDPSAPDWLRQLPAVEFLRQMWIQQFHAESGWVVYWRDLKDSPPTAQSLHSPYDPDCRFGNKRSTQWVGYKVHVSETCEPDSPHLITHVETTAAPSTDNLVLDKIHAALAQKECLPGEHLVDTGYTSAEQLVACQVGYGIELIGPVRADLSWQAKANQGFDATAFEIDWHNQTARCPAGQTSTKWKLGQDDYGNTHIKILFRQKTCTHCDFAPDCLWIKRVVQSLCTHRPNMRRCCRREPTRRRKPSVKNMRYVQG
jgi:transposase